MKKIIPLVMLINVLSGSVIFSLSAFAEEVKKVLNDAEDRAAVAAIINVEYQKETAATGTLDVFDSNKVYNLKLISYEPDLIDQEGIIVQRGSFRDVNMGATVIVDAVLGPTDDEKLAFSDWKFVRVEEATAVKKDYSDQEIQGFMKAYLAQKSKFTGTFDIYDESKSAMRNFEIGEFQKEVRKFGNLAISTVEAKDKQTGNKVSLDVTVENKDGVLSVQSVLIK